MTKSQRKNVLPDFRIELANVAYQVDAHPIQLPRPEGIIRYYEYFPREVAPFNRNSITHSLMLQLTGNKSRVTWTRLVMPKCKSYAKEILTRTPGNDLRDRKNVNEQVTAPIFLIF